MTRTLHILLSCIILTACGLPLHAEKSESLPRTLSEALRRLDHELGHKGDYIKARASKIDSLKALLPSALTSDSVRLCEEIAVSYDAFNVDSCIIYYRTGAEKARVTGDKVAAQRMDFMRYARLPVTGIIREAMNGFESLRGKVYPVNKVRFFDAGNRMTLFCTDLYPSSQIRDTYMTASLALADSLIKYLPADNPARWLMVAQKAEAAKDETAEVAALTDILDTVSPDSNLFARAASQLGLYYQRRHQTEKAAYYYALSSISDMRTATLEGVALLRLGALLYDLGDLDRSYHFINEAVEASAMSGSKIRAIEAYQILPKVSKAFSHEDHKRLWWLTALSVSLVIALLAIIAVMLKLRHEMSNLRTLQTRLANANTAKEQNISRFLDLTSIYADRLEEFMRLVRRKIATGQIEDLHDFIKGGNVARNQTKLFCELFDNAFLHIYPDFIKEVNTLLRPDRQLAVTGKHQLDAEMRILAFQRLGIDDSARISRFLGLSVNTIYTYRNKTKGRAINRDTFDTDLMNTGAVR